MNQICPGKFFSDKTMYRHRHEGKNGHPSARMAIPPEKHLFLQGANGNGDSGLVLSTDAKPRLKWTIDLHERFIEAVNQLGGAEKATPKSVLKRMGIQGLTLYHLKSHLQKYRLSKNLHGQTISGSKKDSTTDKIPEVVGPHVWTPNTASQTTKNLQLGEALQMQIEVQQRLHEQLEVQRQLQLRLEAQGKYLQAVLEKAHESLGREKTGTFNLEATKVQLSDLVSQVSTQCLNSAFSGMKELSNLCQKPEKTTQPTDCSVDSCLTSCEVTMREQELHHNPMGLKYINFRAPTELRIDNKESGLQKTKVRYHDDMEECGKHLSMGNDYVENTFVKETNLGSLTMSIGLQGNEWDQKGNYPELEFKGAEANVKFSDRNTDINDSIRKPERQKSSPDWELPFVSKRLNLNVDSENNAASRCKDLDLNGFSWC